MLFEHFYALTEILNKYILSVTKYNSQSLHDLGYGNINTKNDRVYIVKFSCKHLNQVHQVWLITVTPIGEWIRHNHIIVLSFIDEADNRRYRPVHAISNKIGIFKLK